MFDKIKQNIYSKSIKFIVMKKILFFALLITMSMGMSSCYVSETAFYYAKNPYQLLYGIPSRGIGESWFKLEQKINHDGSNPANLPPNKETLKAYSF